MEKYKIVILGDGRIGRAVGVFLKKYIRKADVSFLKRDSEARDCRLLVGALPGELGEKCLELALRYKKDLVDISDVDPPFYLRHRGQIERCGITVIPECGFSPGIVNFIIGRELAVFKHFDSVEVKAGSLSKKKNYFPFLWCFEDLVLEHKIPSWQLVSGRKKRFPAFSALREEKFLGIDAETYFCASGFEHLLSLSGARDFTCRVIRPRGFKDFFSFLNNYGFLDKKLFASTKGILEAETNDNFTLGEIIIRVRGLKIAWQLSSFSGKKEELNSMQKITASAPVIMAKWIVQCGLLKSGLYFMEDLGRDKNNFNLFLSEIKEFGVRLKRRMIRVKND